MFSEQNRIETGVKHGPCPPVRNEDRRHLNEDSHEALTCYGHMKRNAQYSKKYCGLSELRFWGVDFLRGRELDLAHVFCEIPSHDVETEFPQRRKLQSLLCQTDLQDFLEECF